MNHIYFELNQVANVIQEYSGFKITHYYKYDYFITSFSYNDYVNSVDLRKSSQLKQYFVHILN